MTLSLLGISGSLRQGSYNTRLLAAFGRAIDEAVAWKLGDIASLPLYNPDRAEPLPESVALLKRRIDEADGLVIATPEYNYGVPGGLKNAIDWVSRPAYRSVLARKPVALLGASISPVGTARAQGQLKQVLLGTVSDLFPAPELLVGSAAQKFDSNGELSDEPTLSALKKFALEYCAWLASRSQPAGAPVSAN